MRRVYTILVMLGTIAQFVTCGCSRNTAVELVNSKTAWELFLVDRSARELPLIPQEDWRVADHLRNPWQLSQAEIFGDYGYGHPQQVDSICLRTDMLFRRRVIDTLGRTRTAKAIPPLEAMLPGADEETRARIEKALERLHDET